MLPWTPKLILVAFKTRLNSLSLDPFQRIRLNVNKKDMINMVVIEILILEIIPN